MWKTAQKSQTGALHMPLRQNSDTTVLLLYLSQIKSDHFQTWTTNRQGNVLALVYFWCDCVIYFTGGATYKLLNYENLIPLRKWIQGPKTHKICTGLCTETMPILKSKPPLLHWLNMRKMTKRWDINSCVIWKMFFFRNLKIGRIQNI